MKLVFWPFREEGSVNLSETSFFLSSFPSWGPWAFRCAQLTWLLNPDAAMSFSPPPHPPQAALHCLLLNPLLMDGIGKHYVIILEIIGS